MHPPKLKLDQQQRKQKLADSYSELHEEFSSKDLRNVGNYSLGKLIGQGSFGKVYLARHNLTNGSKVVLKASHKDDHNLAREVHHHRQFIHPHIARLYEVIVTESLVWLVLEYCPGDELYHYLLRHGALPVETVQKIFTQLVGAVNYIHSKSCVHRDLKLENVLLDKNENVKLCDFGFTREYEGKANYLNTFCGTICYSAPEMLRGEKYAGEKVDVWSLGIILYALLRGELPFDDEDDTVTKTRILKEEPVYPETFPEAAKSLITKLLSKRAFHRPSLADILADPFLAEHAPQQQAILKVVQPPPFSTPLEKYTLERLRAAGVDIEKVVDHVQAQRCDALAGWWALLLEKEIRKEVKREIRRKEREAEIKVIRRLSGASSRLERLSITLADVKEEGVVGRGFRDRSTSRGRPQRRSTPQILITDLPRLPEGSAVETPSDEKPPPIDKQSIRSQSGSRPPLPPKDRRRRSSTLQIVTNNLETAGPVNGVSKRRGGKTRQNHFINRLASLKHWFIESTKRNKSPSKVVTETKHEDIPNEHEKSPQAPTRPPPSPLVNHDRQVSNTSDMTRSSFGANLTPITSSARSRKETGQSAARNRQARGSISPSPVTPRASAFVRPSGLHGRKSTSSSISSVRSLPRHPNHSKASSVSSNSDAIHSPASRSATRSPRPSMKALPGTPTMGHFSTSVRTVRPSYASEISATTSTTSGNASHDGDDSVPPSPQPGVLFAKRKKPLFKGPHLNTMAFGITSSTGLGSPAFRQRDVFESRTPLALGPTKRRRSRSAKRKSQIIEEDEEEEEEHHQQNGFGLHDRGTSHEEEEEDDGDLDGEDVEEVDAFTPIDIDLSKGEQIQSITIWDDPRPDIPSPERGKGLKNDTTENDPFVVDTSFGRDGVREENGRKMFLPLDLGPRRIMD